MKLRNKKTEKITTNYDLVAIQGVDIDKGIDRICLQTEDGEKYVYSSLADFNAEWEDYGPLIKDEKIRKAVRAWAKANDIPSNVPLNMFEFLGTGLTAIRYLYEAKTKLYKRSVTFEYISSDRVYGSQNDRVHTIAELCGDKE